MAVALDLLVVGGTVIDGTGVPGYRADVGIVDDRIVAIGDLSASVAHRRVDAQDRVVCPGFIDAHSHSDLTLLSDGRARSKVHQGVTTEIVGNCGLSVAPLASAAAIDDVRTGIFIIDPDPGVAWTWVSMADYLARLTDAHVAVNVAQLAGHLALRTSVMGLDARAPTPAELHRMQELLDAALREGAFGLSTGLMYPPISYAAPAELVALGEVVARHDRVFAMHLRNYSDSLVESVEEALDVGRLAGCRVQVSHLCVVGRRNWGKTATALARMDEARAAGVRVRADSYPYVAGSANLSQLLPGWVADGGTARLVERLRSSVDRARILAEWQQTLVQEWTDVLVSWVRDDSPNRSLVGSSIAEIAALRGTPPAGTALDLLAAEEGLVNMIAFGRSETDLAAVLRHPETLIGSDGLAVDPDGPSGSGQPHPRYYGCYPRLLGRYVREQGLFGLAEAVYRSTGLVARTFGIADRGLLQPGYAADLVVFDPSTVVDAATFLEPHQFPTGIDTVVVNGAVVVAASQHTGAQPGRVLRAA